MSDEAAAGESTPGRAEGTARDEEEPGDGEQQDGSTGDGKQQDGSTGDRAPLRENPPPESLRTRLWRYAYNLFPAYRGTGARVDHIAANWRYVRVRIPLNWRTRNVVGTTFGGSLYGAIDPIYMSLLRRSLGDEYTVWDKAADVRFKTPGRDTLYAEFELGDDELAFLRDRLDPGESVDRVYSVRIVDAEGLVHVECEKTIYVRCDA